MATVLGFLNIYKSGFYHRSGKPLCFDRHAGDIYPTREKALEDIHPKELYIATVSVIWEEEKYPEINPANCEPRPLRESRRELIEQGVLSHV